MINPFAPPPIIDSPRGVFGDGAELRRRWFIFRQISFSQPFQGELVYSGWWFRQKVMIDQTTVWWKISWVWFQKRIEFRLPAAFDPRQSLVTINIQFGRGLRIRRFQVSVGDEVVYDEIN